MPVDDELAYALAVQLTLIPECPQSLKALEALADELNRICRDYDEAKAIVTEACDRWDRWRGVRGLIELMESKRPEIPPSNQAKDYGPRPKPDCEQCADWGYFTAPSGSTEWCDCAAGRETRERFPALVEGLNRKQIKPSMQQARADRVAITQADIDRAFAERQDRTEQLVSESRATLADPEASRDRKEIAREILRRYGVQ